MVHLISSYDYAECVYLEIIAKVHASLKEASKLC